MQVVDVMNEPELLDGEAWVAATEERRGEIVDALVAALPEFELAYVRSYAAPREADGEILPPVKGCPIATLRHLPTGVLFNLIPGGTFATGGSAREAAVLQKWVAAGKRTAEEARMVETMNSWAEEGTREVQVWPLLLARFPVSTSLVVRLLGLDAEEAWSFDFEDLDVASFPDEYFDPFLRVTGFRLPTEAEREYACRAGVSTLFWWGDAVPEGPMWTENVEDDAEAERFSNRFGLVNLGAFPETCVEQPSETLASEGAMETDREMRVTRGGAWSNYPWQGVGEWATMLTAGRFADMFRSMRPVYPLEGNGAAHSGA